MTSGTGPAGEAGRPSAGRLRTLTLLVTLRQCAGLPQGVRLPFVNVTLRNARGTLNPSRILGAASTQDLATPLRTLRM